MAARAQPIACPACSSLRSKRRGWSTRTGFAALNDLSKSPIALAARQERHWRYYRAHLEHELEQPLFAGDFSLRQLYQPLRGYWVERKDDAQRRRNESATSSISKRVRCWLDEFDAKDALRVVTGGPGSGKSSFVKWWAWKVLQRERCCRR